MSTTDTAGTAREGMTMSDETTRLRALLERSALPWKVRPLMKGKSHPAIVEDGDGDTVTPIHIGHTSMERSDAHVALIVAAVNALPGLIDAAERAERAERERDDLAATLETRNAEHALALGRVRELEAVIAAMRTRIAYTRALAEERE